MTDYRSTLIVPGLNDSGVAHWQTWWERKDRNALRVTQDNWVQADIGLWSGKVSEAINLSHGQIWIVAHSFGCLASMFAAQKYADRIAGMFLVAPADPDKFGLRGLFDTAVAAPAILVASRTDPWLEFGKAQHWSSVLGGDFIDLGNAGHINAESGFGAWQQGFDLFRNFKRNVEAAQFCTYMVN